MDIQDDVQMPVQGVNTEDEDLTPRLISRSSRLPPSTKLGVTPKKYTATMELLRTEQPKVVEFQAVILSGYGNA